MGLCLRQFVKPQHLLRHFGNTETKHVHSIISPSLSLILSFERMCCFLLLSFSPLQSLPDSESEQLERAAICPSHLWLASLACSLLLLILSGHHVSVRNYHYIRYFICKEFLIFPHLMETNVISVDVLNNAHIYSSEQASFLTPSCTWPMFSICTALLFS